MKQPTQEEELEIYRNLLINLHTARWTGNGEKVIEILNAIGLYSYARTNSNGDWDQENDDQMQTLLNLKNI